MLAKTAQNRNFRSSRLGETGRSGHCTSMTGNSAPALRLGTRGSRLAMAQARMVAAALAHAHDLDERSPDAPAIELVPLQTIGDRVQDRALAEIGGKSLWTKELDAALLDGRIDLAVHSMKDVETFLPPGIAIAAVLERGDPRDRLLGAASLTALPAGATVGTSSPRRAAQLLHRRPDLRITNLRGNVETRIRRIDEGTADATLLAAAGLERLGIDVGTPLPVDSWLPASAQGIIGITCRAADQRTRTMLAAIDHAPTHARLAAERAVLEGVGGNCHTSIAIHADFSVDSPAGPPAALRIRAALFAGDGRERVDAELSAAEEPRRLGLALAALLLDRASPGIRATLAGGPAA